MIIRLTKPINFKNKIPFEMEISETIKNKIDNYWKEFTKGKTGYWDGDVFVVTNIDENNIEVSRTKYSSIVYAKFHKDLTIRSLFASILLKTTDNKYVIIKNNHNIFNIIGGMADKSDFKNDIFYPDYCIKREVLEEIGIDLDNKTQVLDYEMKYLKVPKNNENYYTIGILYTGSLNFSSEEFKQYLMANKFDDEINEYYLCSTQECLNMDFSDIDVSYIKEFISIES